MQRNTQKFGYSLGKTTGWIHRLSLKKLGLTFLCGVSYQQIDNQGLHISINNKQQILAVDHVVICAGQEPENPLYKTLIKNGKSPHLIGGALSASHIDAQRAILKGARLAYRLETRRYTPPKYL